MAYGRWAREGGEVLLLPGTATTRCEVELDYYFGHHTGTVEVVVDVTTNYAPGTDAFEKVAARVAHDHGDAGIFVVAGCNGQRVRPVGFGVELTEEREGGE